MNRKKAREKKILRQQEIMAKAKEEKRDLTEEERREFDGLQEEIEDLTREIEEEEKTQASNTRENDKTEEMIREAERMRCSEITNLCRETKLEKETERFIREGKSVEQVQKEVIERMKETGKPLGARGVAVETDEKDKFRAAATDAILMRGGINMERPAAGANELRGLSLRDLAVECLEAEGETKAGRRSNDEIFSAMQRQFYNPEAAFPAILDNVIQKAYVEGHKTAPVTFDQWVKKGTLSDFKVHDNNYISGSLHEFEKVPENGELKHDIWKDEKRPTRRLETYGKQITLSRKAFIDDDIGVVTSIPKKAAAAARKTQNKQCYQILMDNPVIYDGAKLFDKKHSNLLASGTGVTREAVQGMIMALANQKDEFGEACIIRPAIIVVPSGYMFDMYTLFYSPTINTTDNTQAVNPLYQYRESIKVVEDPTINALSGGLGNVMPWWLIGAMEDTDFMEVDYLNGQEIPNIRRSEQAGTLGYIWDMYLDWGISVMDFRGSIKNPGVVVKNPVALA